MSGGRLSKPARLFFKVEGTSGTEEAVAAVDAIPTSNLQLVGGHNAKSLDRNLDRGSLGASPTIKVGEHYKFGFNVEMTAPGIAADTIPQWAKLFRAGGHSVNQNTGVDCRITPIDSLFETATAVLYLDGEKMVSSGSVLSKLTLDASSETIPVFSMETIGLWKDPVTEAIPAQDLSLWKNPEAVQESATPIFTFQGQNLQMQSFNLEWGLSANYRNRVNSKKACIDDRVITAKATIAAESTAIATYLQKSLAGENGAFRMVHGSGAPGTVEVNCLDAHLDVADINRSGNDMMVDLTWQMLPDNNELEIITIGAV